MITAVALWSKKPTVSVGRIFLLNARREYRSLEEWMFEDETLQLPLHEIEQGQIQKMHEIMRLMLQAHIDARGNGDVGKGLEVVKKEGEETEPYTHKRLHTCHCQTVFGKVSIKRTGYGGRGKTSIHPKDESLQLPEKSFSYELQKRLVKASVQGPFDEAVKGIEEYTGATISKKSVEDIVKEAPSDFDDLRRFIFSIFPMISFGFYVYTFSPF